MYPRFIHTSIRNCGTGDSRISININSWTHFQASILLPLWLQEAVNSQYWALYLDFGFVACLGMFCLSHNFFHLLSMRLNTKRPLEKFHCIISYQGRPVILSSEHMVLLHLFFFFFLNYFFYLWWILSYIEMKQPWVYMCSPSQTPLPPPSPPVPSRFSQCTRSERLSHASNLGWCCTCLC